MSQEIKTINVGGVNCFLVKSDTGFVLIDTGVMHNPKKIGKELEDSGCKPGNLKIVILTHGDFDHSGNAAYIRKKFNSPIAMHIGDIGKVEHGDQLWGNKSKPDKVTAFGKIIIFVSRFFVKSMNLTPFKPDLIIDEDFDLSVYGLDARILWLPGHTKGSIGVLTKNGEFFCGDLYMNMIKPNIHFLIDDLEAEKASLKKLKNLEIKTVYPGHGKPFSYEKMTNSYNMNPKWAKRGVFMSVLAILILTILEFPAPIGFETRPQNNVSLFWLVFFLVIVIIEITTIPLVFKKAKIGAKFGIVAAVFNIFQVIADQTHLMQEEVAPLGYSLLEYTVVIFSLALIYFSWKVYKKETKFHTLPS